MSQSQIRRSEDPQKRTFGFEVARPSMIPVVVSGGGSEHNVQPAVSD